MWKSLLGMVRFILTKYEPICIHGDRIHITFCSKIRHRAPGHQWSVSRASAGLLVCHSAHVWLLVCWLLVASLPFIQFKGTAGGLLEITRVTGFAHFIRPFFLNSFFGAKVANMCRNGTKKWSKNDPKSRFLPTWGTSFRYGIYWSGATLAHPGEVPKAIKKTSLQKDTQN